MTDQLELSLDYRVLDVARCPHTALRYDGMLLDEVPLVTCYHPHRPHCGGTFDARKFTRNGAVMEKGKLYILEELRNWYGSARK